MESYPHSTALELNENSQVIESDEVELLQELDQETSSLDVSDPDEIDMSDISLKLRENLLSHFKHYDSLYFPQKTEENKEFCETIERVTSLSLLKHEDLRPLANALLKSYNNSTRLKLMKESNLRKLTHSSLTFVGIDDLKAVNKLKFDTDISKTRFKKQLDVILTVVINKFSDDLKSIHTSLWFLGVYLLRLDLSQYEVWFELESYDAYSKSLQDLVSFYFAE